MEITAEQYERIQDCLPVQRGNVRHQNLVLLNAILYVAEHGCKWRGLPKRFGNWHSIYVRMNRWAKKGVLDQVFAKLQQEQILRLKIEAFSLDSTSVKVHPDPAGQRRPLAGRQSWCVSEHREFASNLGHRDLDGRGQHHASARSASRRPSAMDRLWRHATGAKQTELCTGHAIRREREDANRLV